MLRISFTRHQRTQLQALGVPDHAIALLEGEVLPAAQQLLRKRPRRNDVLAELKDLSRSLTKASASIERTLAATRVVPHRWEALSLLSGGYGRHAMGGLRLSEASEALARATRAVQQAIDDVPPGPVRQRVADPYPIQLIQGALAHGAFAAYGDPNAHQIRPSLSPTSPFRQIVGLCYEALKLRSADPERALRAYMKQWRAIERYEPGAWDRT